MPEPISKQGSSDGNRSTVYQSNPIQNCGMEVSSRICLSRNLATYPFFDACSVSQRQEIFQTLTHSDWLQQNADRFAVVDCQQLKLHEQQFLQELQAIVGFEWAVEDNSDQTQIENGSPAHGETSESSVVPAVPLPELGCPSSLADEVPGMNSSCFTQSIHLLLNGEDHLCIEAWGSRNQLAQQWRQVSEVDDQLQRDMGFAFHPQFGYLTASPGDVGTGLRASLLLHLPALVSMSGLPSVLAGLTRKNLSLREAFGDPGAGNFFRLSNLGTLGTSESQLLNQLETAATDIVAAEQAARHQWQTFHLPELKRQTDQSVRRLRASQIAELNLASLDDARRWELLRDLSQLRLALQMQLVAPADAASIGKQFHRVHLEGLLKSAIAREDYQTASQLRDRIKVLGGAA